MSGSEIRQRRIAAGIAGRLLCARAKIDRSRLSHIERGYIQPSKAELERLTMALDSLTAAKKRVADTAAECGWPMPV